MSIQHIVLINIFKYQHKILKTEVIVILRAYAKGAEMSIII